MILHDFIYEWDGKKTKGEQPISWWPGAYHVKIVNLERKDTGLNYLFPIAVILKNAKTHSPMNTSLKNYIHNFAKKISNNYHLDINKTMWIEIDDEIQVARLNPDQKLVPETLYSISWRPIRPNEFELIKPYIADM